MAEVLLFFYYSFPFVFIPFFIPNSREGNVKRQKKSCFKVPLFSFLFFLIGEIFGQVPRFWPFLLEVELREWNFDFFKIFLSQVPLKREKKP